MIPVDSTPEQVLNKGNHMNDSRSIIAMAVNIIDHIPPDWGEEVSTADGNKTFVWRWYTERLSVEIVADEDQTAITNTDGRLWARPELARVFFHRSTPSEKSAEIPAKEVYLVHWDSNDLRTVSGLNKLVKSQMAA
jgi:hypothetical protein